MSKNLQRLPASLLALPRSASVPFQQSARNIHLSQTVYRSTPMNTIVLFVPQQEAWVVERMGKFQRVLEPGLNFLIPILDGVKYVQSLKEIAIDIPQQAAISADNVTLTLDGVLYLRVFNPYKASYGVEDAEFAITQLAQTTMRSEIGKITLDTVFRERESLNVSIVESINKASEAWGITCLRYEIRDIQIPKRIQEAMHSQVESERKKRAAILESEGIRTSDINIAEGQKQSRILASEAEKLEKINRAEGDARGIIANAEARSRSLVLLAEALSREEGQNAASLNVAELYVDAFKNLAKSTNTILLPANTSDVSAMVAQAMSVYKTLASQNSQAQKMITPPSANDQIPSYDRAEYYSDDETGKK